jgi:hypothetical protein
VDRACPLIVKACIHPSTDRRTDVWMDGCMHGNNHWSDSILGRQYESHKQSTWQGAESAVGRAGCHVSPAPCAPAPRESPGGTRPNDRWTLPSNRTCGWPTGPPGGRGSEAHARKSWGCTDPRRRNGRGRCGGRARRAAGSSAGPSLCRTRSSSTSRTPAT